LARGETFYHPAAQCRLQQAQRSQTPTPSRPLISTPHIEQINFQASEEQAYYDAEQRNQEDYYEGS
jgi:hypothetical protein